MELRTARLGVLLDQFETSRQFATARLAGLTDDEFLWEPAPGAWSLRRRGSAVSRDPFGAGEWQVDFELGREIEAVGPVTTIAWRLAHLVWGFESRWHWTFGPRSTPPEELVTFESSAAGMLAQLDDTLDRWHTGLASLTDEQLDMVGFGQFPYGLDPQLPFIGIVWWTNREYIHHTAEIGVLRDLWSVRDGA
jgi:hypothetical protein